MTNYGNNGRKNAAIAMLQKTGRVYQPPKSQNYVLMAKTKNQCITLRTSKLTQGLFRTPSTK